VSPVAAQRRPDDRIFKGRCDANARQLAYPDPKDPHLPLPIRQLAPPRIIMGDNSAMLILGGTQSYLNLVFVG
jgi:hypothetical protein